MKRLCEQRNVPLVADETLSAVRCGENLLSAALKPDYLMLGKAFGCALLLSRHDYKVEFQKAVSVMTPAFRLIAFVLRYTSTRMLPSFVARKPPKSDKCWVR